MWAGNFTGGPCCQSSLTHWPPDGCSIILRPAEIKSQVHLSPEAMTVDPVHLEIWLQRRGAGMNGPARYGGIILILQMGPSNSIIVFVTHNRVLPGVIPYTATVPTCHKSKFTCRGQSHTTIPLCWPINISVAFTLSARTATITSIASTLPLESTTNP